MRWQDKNKIKEDLAADVKAWRKENANLRFIARGNERLPSQSDLKAIADLASYLSELDDAHFRGFVITMIPRKGRLPRLSIGQWRVALERFSLLTSILYGTYGKTTGRPQMEEDERRAKNPLHDAAVEAEAVVIPWLKEKFPNQTAKNIKERAAEIVGPDYRVPPKTLEHYLTRSKTDFRKANKAKK